MSNFGEHLKQLRVFKEITQKNLANAIGASERGIQNYELNLRKPTYEILIALADFFDISLDRLVNRKNKLFSQPDGTLKYNLRDFEGNMLAGEFQYSFGAFKFSDLYIKFFYVQDLEGTLISKIQDSKSSFEFLAFLALVNDALKLNYELPKQKNGLHIVDFIVRERDTRFAVFRYKKLFLDLHSGKVIVEEMFWEGYENFIREYLEWETEKKVEFVATHY